MTFLPQVEAGHYSFQNYLSKERWASLWHQLHEMHSSGGTRFLEVGPGPGVLTAVARMNGLTVHTLDFDPRVSPDIVASTVALPFHDRSFDAVCAFQVLEHLPYDAALLALAELTRIAKMRVLVSLPDAEACSRLRGYVPWLGMKDVLLPKPWIRPVPHEFDGEHYWEVNKRGFELSRVRADLERMATVLDTYRLMENPYHRFFILAPRG